MKKIPPGLIFLLVSSIVLFLNYFPHYYGLAKTPENFFYSGQVSWFDPWDINNYFAAIRWAQEKRGMFLENFNTTEPHQPAFIYPLYMMAGNLFPQIDHFVLFHGLAIIGGLLLSGVIFISSYLLLKNVAYSLTALILISLGGGLGWLFSSPEVAADTSIPGVAFFSSFQKPHEAMAAILYLFSLVFYFLSVKQRRPLFNLCSLALLLLLIPFYPYRLLSYFLICGLFAFVYLHREVGSRALASLGLNLLISLPLGFLYLLHFTSSGFSVLTGYQQPFFFPSLILGYGLFLPIFIYQLFHLSLKDKTKAFLNIWFLASLFLSLLPLGMARLFLSGLLFPLVLINLLSLKDIAKNFPLNPLLIIFILLIFTPLSSLYIFNNRMKGAGHQANVWFYLPLEIKAGFEFLESRKETGVLAAPLISSYTPPHAGKKVYCGHRDQTPGFQEKSIKTIKFYSGEFSPAEAERFLRENKINFVIYSDEEKQIGQLEYPFLKSVYKNDKMEIFASFASQQIKKSCSKVVK